MSLKPITNKILFQFIDRVNSKGQFDAEATASGILLQGSFDDSAKQPRWAKVVAVGPDCKHVTPGVEILLPALRWTSAVKHEGVQYWKTGEDEVVAVRTAEGTTPINNFVIFTPIKVEAVRKSSVLFLIGGNDETPRGKTVMVGPNVDPTLTVGMTIYYDTTNFFENFTNNGSSYSFIRDDAILMAAED